MWHGLHHLQTSPQSLLTSVHNIVMLWKEHTPSVAHTGRKSGSVTSVSPPPDGEGHFGIRRQVQHVRTRLRKQGIGGDLVTTTGHSDLLPHQEVGSVYTEQ